MDLSETVRLRRNTDTKPKGLGTQAPIWGEYGGVARVIDCVGYVDFSFHNPGTRLQIVKMP